MAMKQWNVLTFSKRKSYSDREVVYGLQSRDRNLEQWFYETARRYFNDCFNEIFFDKDRKQEIFQSAFLKMWMEIENRTIRLVDEVVCRKQKNGLIQPMTCSLLTFLMSFAKNEYRELMRSCKEETFAELYETAPVGWEENCVTEDSDDLEEWKNRIVDECMQKVSPNCLEILTLFYYEGKSLDEILLSRHERNSSKNGLKTAKNKCMNTLRDSITMEFQKHNLII